MKISKSKLKNLLSGFPITLKEIKRVVYVQQGVVTLKKVVTDTIPLDPLKEIKKFYHHGPDKFLLEYTEWFFKHHDKMVLKYPEHFVKMTTQIK